MSNRDALRALALVFLAVLFFSLLSRCFEVVNAAATDPPPANGVIVQFRDATQVQSNWRPIYGQANRYVIPTETHKLTDTLTAYAARPDVLLAEPNYIVTLDPDEPADTPGLILSAVNDPRAAEQWALERVNASSAWDVTHGDNVTIASVDTGVDCTHPDLQSKCLQGMSFDPTTTSANDNNGHGTHTAGTAAASTGNGIGVASVGYNARILPVKALDASGSGDHGAIASSVRWAADHGANVINLSLGGPYDTDTLRSAIEYADTRHVVVVASAGNDASRTDLYPAAYPSVISVCATDSADKKADFSNYAASVDVCAPGVGILSTIRGGGYGTMSGTSMAAPHVAGIAALVKASRPSWGASQIKSAIETSADGVLNVGHGRVNAARAVGSSAPSPTPGPTPAPSSDDFAAQVVNGINQARAGYSLAPFTRNEKLDDAADFHNRFMVNSGNCFSHQCPGEPDPFTRIRNAGYSFTTASEVIAAGYQTPADAVNGWLGSPGHRAILLGGAHEIGCGFLYKASSQYGFYWTCVAATPSGVIPPPTRIYPTLTPVPRPTVPTPSPLRQPWRVQVEFYYGVSVPDVMVLVNLCKLPLVGCRWTPPAVPWPGGTP